MSEIQVAIISTGNSISLTNLKSGNSIKTFKQKSSMIAIFKNIIISTYFNKMTVQSLNSNLNFTFSIPEQLVCATTSNLLYVGASDSGRVYIWFVNTGQMACWFDAHYGKVTCLAFSNCQSYLLTGGNDGLIHSWLISDLLENTVKPARTFNHNLCITGIQLSTSPISRAVLYSSSKDKVFKKFDFNTGLEISSIVMKRMITCFTIDLMQEFGYIGLIDGSIARISLSDFKCVQGFIGHETEVTHLSLSFDCENLLSSSCSKTILFCTKSRLKLREFVQDTIYSGYYFEFNYIDTAIQPFQKFPGFDKWVVGNILVEVDDEVDVDLLIKDRWRLENANRNLYQACVEKFLEE